MFFCIQGLLASLVAHRNSVQREPHLDIRLLCDPFSFTHVSQMKEGDDSTSTVCRPSQRPRNHRALSNMGRLGADIQRKAPCAIVLSPAAFTCQNRAGFCIDPICETSKCLQDFEGVTIWLMSLFVYLCHALYVILTTIIPDLSAPIFTSKSPKSWKASLEDWV